jgi:ABC-type antimicrobial peptide transport system permease subunit
MSVSPSTSPTVFFRAALAEELSPALHAPVAPIILLRGTAAAAGTYSRGEGGDVRVGRVQVIGVTGAFWEMGPRNAAAGSAAESVHPDTESVTLNDRLARALGVKVGDEVLVRVEKPGLLSRDAPLSTIEEATVTLRLPVHAIVTDARFGRFSLEANQIPPFSAFVTLETLQRAVALPNRVNTLLVGDGNARQPVAFADAHRALWERWKLDDAGLELRELEAPRRVELRTSRVFLDAGVGAAARQALPRSQGVLTYFVNELRVGSRATPYSTVAALQGPLIPSGMRDDETLINQWLAEDLKAKVGDSLTLTYWRMGPMRRLEQQSRVFRIRGILPMTGMAGDPDLMPNIPGLSDKKDCREWEPGVPVDLDRIRDKDQAYWDAYRGTPKAFLTLRTGQSIWSNRFGDLTAVRYPSAVPGEFPRIAACVRQALNPASLGLFFIPLRERALAASTPSLDFGQLFLAFSFFLIIAALLLTGLLFALGAEQRTAEVGTLLAVGFPPSRVQGLLLREGGALALLAALIGAGIAVVYTRILIGGLSTVWRGAVADAPLLYYVTPQTLVIGATAGFLMALLAIALVTRRQARAPARELLASGRESQSRFGSSPNRRFLPGLPTAVLALLFALVLTVLAMVGKGGKAGYFFGAGGLLLVGGIGASRALLAHWERSAVPAALTLSSLSVRNAVRRPGRSLGIVALFACGSFLVIAVGANRHDPNEGAQRRTSGTGGFALYGEASLPVFEDLNRAEGRESFALDEDVLQNVEMVALRLREGDDASCLNLNRAQTPRLFGVAPDALARRGAFTFAQSASPIKGRSPWTLLNRPLGDGAIPVIGDTNTVVWSLGKKLGDTLSIVDERGATIRLRIVGVLVNSILQGGLILGEDDFTRLFPAHSGYQIFLIDAPPARADTVSRMLTRSLEDVGLSVTPAATRMAAFNTVENTYLSIFAVLGGMGLLLGSAGLGVIVLRNVLERRAELALLRAVGFSAPALHRLVFAEHALLLLLGLGVGIISALIAVLPALQSPGAEVPYRSLVPTLLAVLASGIIWTWAATASALRSPLLEALREE